MAYQNQHLAAELVNKVTDDLMALTHLPREECLCILRQQLTRSTTPSTPILEPREYSFIRELFA